MKSSHLYPASETDCSSMATLTILEIYAVTFTCYLALELLFV